MIKTAFFGTSDKSIPLLEQLKRNTELSLCITKTDRIIGRKKENKSTKVKQWAIDNSVEVLELERFDPQTTELIVRKLKDLEIQVGVVADFSFIIPSIVLHTPYMGLVNIHFSKLPKYRGASPVQHTILNGDKETAVTFMKMGEKMDEGDLIKQIAYNVPQNATTLSLYEELFNFAADHLIAILTDYVSGNLQPYKQPDENISYCYLNPNSKSTLINKGDAQIDWQKSPLEIERVIRAFYPWPLAWTYIGEIKMLGYTLKHNVYEHTKVKIISAKLDNGVLIPTTVQPENKNKMDFKSFLNGYFTKN